MVVTFDGGRPKLYGRDNGGALDVELSGARLAGDDPVQRGLATFVSLRHFVIQARGVCHTKIERVF
jgi:hypothetical protein